MKINLLQLTGLKLLLMTIWNPGEVHSMQIVEVAMIMIPTAVRVWLIGLLVIL